jgi:hypothetical protein
MRKTVVLVLLVLSVIAAPGAARAAPTIEDLRLGAAHAQQLNALIAQFSLLYEETMAFDTLAEAVFKRQVAGPEATRRVGELSATMRARHAELSGQLAALPAAPVLSDETVRRTLANTRQMTDTARDIALEAVEAGESLVAAAMHGEPDFYLQRTVKNLRLTQAQLRSQSQLYQQQLDIEAERNVSYYLYAAMKLETDIVHHVLGAEIDLIEGRTVTTEALGAPKAMIAEGRTHIATGRATFDAVMRQL